MNSINPLNSASPPAALEPFDESRFRRILNRHMSVPLGFGLVSVIFFIVIVNYLIALSRWVEDTDQVITSAGSLLQLIVDQETGLRGFLITGSDEFLDPYQQGSRRAAATFDQLGQAFATNPAQRRRLEELAVALQGWREYAQNAIAVRRAGNAMEPLLASGRGKQLVDEMRGLVADMVDEEQQVKSARRNRAQNQVIMLSIGYFALSLLFSALMAYWGRRQLLGLAGSYSELLRYQSEQTADLRARAWLQSGQTALAEKIIGQLPLPILCQNILNFLAEYLGSVVGAVYVGADEERFARTACYGFSREMADREQVFAAGEGLLGQVVIERRSLYFNPVNADYFKVNSGLGEGDATAVAIVPIISDTTLNAILEIGFLRELTPRDREFLELVRDNIGAAIAAANYRRRLHEALLDMQQLNDELQAQQEELRMANEELEEQSTALEESQVRLEEQQAELEQSNMAIAEQHEIMRLKNEALELTQQRLEEHSVQLEKASRYKSEFLANMSHELRTPLNSSLILSKMLADNSEGNLSAEQVKFAESIYTAGNDLLTMINDILDISKVEAGKFELRLDTFPLPRMLQTLLQQFHALAQEKQVELELEVEQTAPGTLCTDRQRLEQILRNLISNALKFTARGSIRIRVSAPAPQRVAFEVSDTGIGIDADQIGRIFDPFYQVDSTDSRRYGGTGLGLSISQQLAGLLGGRIAVSSVCGEGSTFTLDIPVSRAGENAAGDSAAVALRVHDDRPRPAAPRQIVAAVFNDDRERLLPGRRTLLVVEDEITFAGILYDYAQQMNYQCLVATSAEEGIALALKHGPQAIVLDMKLPDQSGLNVLARLKDDPSTRHIPVHVISVEDRSETALSMGAIGYLLKPVAREQLQQLFDAFEKKTAQKMKRVLVVEATAEGCHDTTALIADVDVSVNAVTSGAQALELLRSESFDCLVIDLDLADMRGEELLQRMSETDGAFPPVIVHASRDVSRDEEERLLQFSRSIIIKGARSPERLLDEVTLFLHKVEADLSADRRELLQQARHRDNALQGRRILVVDDDVRNIFAITSALEHKGAAVEIGRNGVEAIEKLEADAGIELVLMDIMMPEMDGYQAMETIRKNPRFARLPIIAVTARAMPDDQDRCLRAGASDYVAKPVDMDRLISLIRVWLPKLRGLIR